MTKGKSIMDNSILPILPGIHATILSIIFAVLIVFFFYSYQTANNLKEQMNDLRIKAARAMSHQVCLPLKGVSSFELEDYFKDNTLNHLNIEKKLWELSSVMGSLEITKMVPPHPRMGEDYIEKTIIESAEDFLRIITILTYIYPYCERPLDEEGIPSGISNIIRKEYTPEWHQDMEHLNSHLSWLWQTKGDGFTKLISGYDAISAKKTGKQEGFRFNYSLRVADFFKQVRVLETQIIPELNEKSHKLNFYENKFKIKTHLLVAFSIAIPMLVVGIFLPLVIHLWNKPPYIKGIELFLLIITLLPYFCLLLYYLKKTLELEFR